MLAKLFAMKRLREEVTKEDVANKELDYTSKKQVSHMGVTCTPHECHMHIMQESHAYQGRYTRSHPFIKCICKIQQCH